MDKANVIISIIIVLCIAAAVAAYGITNSNNPIFSDLSSMNANNDAGNGLGNNTTAGNGSSVAVTNSAPSTVSSGSGSGSSGSSSSGSSSSSSSSSSGSSSSGSSSSDSSSSDSDSPSTSLSYSDAKSIASGAIEEEGCYAGSGYYSGGYWYFTIYDADGNAVDGIAVNDATGMTERA
ncbi:endoglucanase [Methanobrevibacter sp.]